MDKKETPTEVEIIILENKIQTLEAAKDLCKHNHAIISVSLWTQDSEIRYVLRNNENLISLMNAEKRGIQQEIEAMKHLIENE